MRIPLRAVAPLLFLALTSAHAQEPARPKPLKVTITYKAKGGGMLKASGTWTPPAKPGASAAVTAIMTPRAAGGYASVVPYVVTGLEPPNIKGVWFNAYDANGQLVKSSGLNKWGNNGGTIGNGTADICDGFEGTGNGVGVTQFSVGP